MSATLKLIKEAKELKEKLEGASSELYLIIRELGISESAKKRMSKLLVDVSNNSSEEEKKVKSIVSSEEKSPIEQVDNYEGWKIEYETEEEVRAKYWSKNNILEKNKCYMFVISNMKQDKKYGKGLILLKYIVGWDVESEKIIPVQARYHITITEFISDSGKRSSDLGEVIDNFMGWSSR